MSLWWGRMTEPQSKCSAEKVDFKVVDVSVPVRVLREGMIEHELLEFRSGLIFLTG
jgi:hypothetical protein